jgi:hypothetical protein
MVMERHETLAITFAVVFLCLAAWRIWRRGSLGPRERPVYLSLAAIAALGIIWTAHVGGTIVYGYGGGVPTQVLKGALAERAAPHTHAPGEGHDNGSEETDDTSATGADDHVDPPGTPPHDH